MPEGFSLQLKAIENLYRAVVEVQPAVIVSFSSTQNINALQKRLGQIAPELSDIEVEELVLYGDVEERLKKVDPERRLVPLNGPIEAMAMPTHRKTSHPNRFNNQAIEQITIFQNCNIAPDESQP
ncbi:MAG: hypothetical protein FJ130_02500 [Deltaproteobacteria bacterium]|nr:hypothetical protein [Deltaproteobacteria bacterium]